MKSKKQNIRLAGSKNRYATPEEREGKRIISIKVSARVADIWRKWRKTYSSSATRVSDSAILAATIMPHEEMRRIWDLLDSGGELTPEAVLEAKNNGRTDREKFIAELRGDKPAAPQAATPIEIEPITIKLMPGGLTFDDGTRGDGITYDKQKWTFRKAVIDPLKARTPEQIEYRVLDLVDLMERTTAEILNLPEPATNPRLITLEAAMEGGVA